MQGQRPAGVSMPRTQPPQVRAKGTVASRQSQAASLHSACMRPKLATYQQSATLLLPQQIRELTPAEVAKDDGNDAFKKGDWQRAIDRYDAASCRWFVYCLLVNRSAHRVAHCIVAAPVPDPGRRPQVLCGAGAGPHNAARSQQPCVGAAEVAAICRGREGLQPGTRAWKGDCSCCNQLLPTTG